MRTGDYVRTKQKGLQPPQIAKIKSMKRDVGYNNQYYIELDHNLLPDYNFYIYEEDIEKASPRIIDLIEVGDYVNEERIDFISFGEIYSNYNSNEYICFKNKNIESIVTKEMYSSIEYRVENN